VPHAGIVLLTPETSEIVMNAPKSHAITLTALAMALSPAAHAAAGPQSANNLKQIGIAYFQGTDRNWFNPANWSTGRVPGENDVVVLDGNDDVLIDPSQASGRTPGKINLNTIWEMDSARLETLPGTHLVAKLQVVDEQAAFITRSSIVEVETAVMLDGLAGTNPSGWYVKRPWVALGGTMYFGLGGREPAGLNKVGAGTLSLGYGYYATLDTSEMVLGGGTFMEPVEARFRAAGRLLGLRSASVERSGEGKTEQTRQVTVIQDMVDEAAGRATDLHATIQDLPSSAVSGFLSRPVNLPPPPAAASARIDKVPRLVVALHYDFMPAVGDSFQIITTNSLVGEFADLPEGALVGCTEDDGVAVHITYRGGDGNDVVLTTRPGDPVVCQTKEHILLARQVGL
jgi:hypothetical protein